MLCGIIFIVLEGRNNLDLTGVKAAADEITKEALPLVIKELDSIVTRFEKLVERLNGATITIVLKGDSHD